MIASDNQLESSPLEGLRVVDTTTYMAGPYGALMLADLGADVIKVEQPDHDPFRRVKSPWHPAAAMMANCNRNKRSIVMDLKSESGREEFFELVRRADVVIFNMRASAASKLGIDDTTLSSINGRLIRMWISGYGSTGPRSDDAAFDSAVQAYTGMVAAQTGSGAPAVIKTYVVDKATAMFVAQGVLAALVKRSVTGKGGKVDLSLLDCASYFGFPDLLEDYTFLDQEQTQGSSESGAVVAATADGYLVMAPASGKQIKAALDVVNHPEWKRDLLSAPNRNTLLTMLVDKFRPVLRTATTAEWLSKFSAADVPVAPVLDPKSHLTDEQVLHNHIYGTYKHPEFGTVRAVRFPVLFAGGRPVEPSPFPAPDADRDEVMKWITE